MISYGDKCLIEPLDVNDLFLYKYGSRMIKFRVNESFGGNGLMAHSVQWSKSDSIFFYPETEVIYVGKMSWIRSLFLL